MVPEETEILIVSEVFALYNDTQILQKFKTQKDPMESAQRLDSLEESLS